MPKNFKEIFTALASKAGMDVKSEDFVNAVNAPDFERLTLPDEIFSGMDSGLLNMDTAKNHPEVKRHYYALAFDGLDKTMISQAEEERFDPTVIESLKKIQSTPERLKALNKALKEHEAKKSNTGKVDKQAWEAEKAAFQEELRLAKEEAPRIKSEYEGKLREKDMMYAKRGVLSRLKTIDDDLDPEVKTAMHDAIINSGLRKLKAKLDVDPSGNLLLVGEDGGIVYDDTHRPINANTFIEKAFADSKRLKVTEPAATPAATYQRPTPTGNQNGSTPAFVPGNKTANSTVINRNMQAILDMEANAAKSGTSMFS
jgi:hypothetical protein